jgi:hypothetical protein
MDLKGDNSLSESVSISNSSSKESYRSYIVNPIDLMKMPFDKE